MNAPAPIRNGWFNPSALQAIRDPWIVILVASLAAFHSFFFNQRTLWVDEAYSVLMARRSISEIFAALRFDAGPPLYYTLLHGWRFFVGESPFAMRFFSLIPAVLATLCLYRIASRLWNCETGRIAAWIFALTPITTAYIQEARNYTLFAWLSVAFGDMLTRYLFEGKRKSLIACGIFALALVYTHNMGWFVGLAGALYVLGWGRNRKRQFVLAGCGVLVILLYIPWIPTLLVQMQNTERTIAWVHAYWSPWALIGTMSSFIPGGYTPSYLNLPAFPFWLQGLNALLGILAIGLAISSARNRLERWEWIPLVFLLSGLLVPYGLSFSRSPFYLVGRTDYGLFPYACLLAGMGMMRIPWRAARQAMFAWFILMAVVANMVFFQNSSPVSERDAILYIEKHSRPGDFILCTGLTRPPFEYALAGKGLVFRSYPRDMEFHLAHMNEAWYDNHLDWKEESRQVLAEIALERTSGRRLWILYTTRPINSPLYDWLTGGNAYPIAARISTPRMGLRKLGEPLTILRID